MAKKHINITGSIIKDNGNKIKAKEENEIVDKILDLLVKEGYVFVGTHKLSDE